MEVKIHMGTLKIVNDKIIITENSESAAEKEEPNCASDAEKRQSPIMNKTDSENKTSSRKEKARNIEGEKPEGKK